MKKFILTEKNIDMVRGLFKKFLLKEGYGFYVSTNYDCGFNNIQPYNKYHFGRYIKPDMIRILDTHRFIEPSNLTNTQCLNLLLIDGVCSKSFDLGSTIIFKGDHILAKDSYDQFLNTANRQYTYTKIGLIKLTDNLCRDIQWEIRKKIKEANEMERAMIQPDTMNIYNPIHQQLLSVDDISKNCQELIK